MNLHANAALTLKARRLLVSRVIDSDWSIADASAAAGTTVKTGRKWVRRFEEDGEAGLLDRSSAPNVVANATPEGHIELIAALRRLRMTAETIAEIVGLAHSTVSGILQRLGLGSLAALEPRGPDNRYEKQRPGELIHIDVKKLGIIGRNGPGHRATGKRKGNRTKGAGWEFVHVCVDDCTRLAYVEVLADEKAVTAIGFLRRAVAHFAKFGVNVERVMTDNGSPYVSTAHKIACIALGIKHTRTRPYTPRTNGKAERFIRTMLGGWAYGAIYGSSAERTAALAGWLEFYNFERPHRSLGRKPPGVRLFERNNVLGSYT